MELPPAAHAAEDSAHAEVIVEETVVADVDDEDLAVVEQSPTRRNGSP